MYDKSVTDPLYGTISLTKTEADVVSAKTFQRLHNVRQLGLAHLVFPSAGYSRFAHSIGAAHNASRMLDAIELNAGTSLDKGYKQAYRMAALLHDVGHYPFSHTTEHAVDDFYAGSLLQGSLLDGDDYSGSVNHEEVGSLILDHDPEIEKILSSSASIDLALLKGIFSKTIPDPLFGIISSELDCDRLDYLGRTSKQSGVPFGTVDTEFIISKATLGDEGELVFDRKASKAIDHLLVGRYYDYMQMVHHKTVEGLEWSLAECIKYALSEDNGLLSKGYVADSIVRGNWWQNDDNWFIDIFKRLEASVGSSESDVVLHDHLAAILYRRPAKRLWKWEAIKDREDDQINTNFKLAQKAVRDVSTALSLNPKRFHIADRRFKLVKLSAGDCNAEGASEEKARSVKIRSRTGVGYLVEDQSLLLHKLSAVRNFAVSIYYLPAEHEKKEFREQIRSRLNSEFAS